MNWHDDTMTANKPVPQLNFSTQEFAARLQKTRTAMQVAQIDTLVVSDPANMNWLTGYDGWSFYVHQGVIVPGTGDPVWWGRWQDANGARRGDLLGNFRVLPALSRAPVPHAVSGHPARLPAPRRSGPDRRVRGRPARGPPRNPANNPRRMPVRA